MKNEEEDVTRQPVVGYFQNHLGEKLGLTVAESDHAKAAKAGPTTKGLQRVRKIHGRADNGIRRGRSPAATDKG